ncbi:MAG: prepilin-type N-terminal cleavage/methylation domain-containing protein [Deltaproteobacteria bacterium]|nr:prepilin-type N-terminal cleavage/methylation domain-containing protein [Deltaproteobacteria bacterium]MBW2363281.1 prepilin-type N-terminal cleavage/methylation domain-containing protein [Deltaproteobacteria bacterium]
MANRDGFSLLEVMIALGVLAVGLLLATSGQIQAMKFSSTSRRAVLAMQLAEEQMETFHSMPATDVKTLGTANDGDNPLDPDPNDGVAMAFTRSWIITPGSPEADTIALQVDVTWADAVGTTRMTSLQSIKADL